MHVRDLVILRLFVESTDLLNNSMICQGIYFIFYLLFPYGLTYLYSLFLLAETLKYRYLLFDYNELDEWVFINNAEAHPLFST